MSLESRKRLAKNTLALYARTFITLIVSLYTARIILDALGETDYGIYTLVAGVVIMFSFLNGAFSYATERFLTVELGRKNLKRMKDVFSISMSTMIILVLVFLLIAETIGSWIINSKLNIPEDRLVAANWAYQFSIITFCINVLRTPFRATIVSYERMTFFAYVSIFESFLKLAIVYCLQLSNYDKLILYSVLLAISSLLINIIYLLYCKRKFITSSFRLFWDQSLFTKLISFSGWNLFGNMTNVLTQNGTGFILNAFYGVGINASLGIAYQVNAAVVSFISGFQTSFAPQIVKLYSQNKHDQLHKMINSTSKFSFMLMAIPAFILLFNMEKILSVWLTVVPDYTVEFCLWIVAGTLIDAFTGPYYAGIMATGNIKRYQIAISISFLSDLIVIYFLLKFGVSLGWIFMSRFLTRGIINMFIGLYFLNIKIKFNVMDYSNEVLKPVLKSIAIITPIPAFIIFISDHWSELIFTSISIVLISIVTFYKILLNKEETLILKKYIEKFGRRIQI